VRCSWPLAIFACLYAFFERTLLQRVLVKQSSLTISIFSSLVTVAAGGLYAKWIAIH